MNTNEKDLLVLTIDEVRQLPPYGRMIAMNTRRKWLARQRKQEKKENQLIIKKIRNLQVQKIARERTRIRKEQGLCVCGGVPVKGYFSCQKCLNRKKEYYERTKIERINENG